MRKITFALLTFFLFSFKQAHAENYFYVDLKSTYEFNENGGCSISDEFEVTNKFTEKYMPQFEYSIKNTDVENIQVSYNNKVVDPVTEKNDASTKIKINFDDKILGKRNKRSFTIVYDIENLASKTGDVWELSIPKNENINDYEKFTTVLFVPEKFGNEAYITPNYSEKIAKDGKTKYIFNKEELLSSRIVVGFGQYQVFNFIISFQLTNDKPIKADQTISIPPDTSYQRVFYDSITPVPINIDVDDDGNWLAQFSVPANSTLNIKVTGNVQLFANPRKYLTPVIQNLYENIKSTDYWQSSDDSIVSLSKSFSNAKETYDFVTNNLSYDYSLTRQNRMGALNTLKSEDVVSCREFTDLLIALFRAKGIPAREIIGYAYTDNPQLKPILFYNDVLHSWVEYWDFDKKIWISVDPTWGATSKSDYFSKFDLRHFAFTIHGKDDSNPISPGFYNPGGLSKDIFINFGTLENLPEKSPEIKSQTEKLFIFKRDNIVSIKNNNNFALYDKNIKYYYDNSLIYEDNIKIIPPFSDIKKTLKSKYSFLGIATPQSITVAVNNKLSIFKGPRLYDMYSQLIVVFVAVIILSIYIIVKHKKGS